MAGSGEIEVDILFLGLTRSPMLFGVSYMVVVMNFLISMTYFVLTSDFKVIVVFLFLHAVGYVLSQREPLFIQLVLNKSQKCRRCRNFRYHGQTNSYDI